MVRRGSEGLILAGGGLGHLPHRRLSGSLLKMPKTDSDKSIQAAEQSPKSKTPLKRSSNSSVNNSPGLKDTKTNFKNIFSNSNLLNVPVSAYVGKIKKPQVHPEHKRKRRNSLQTSTNSPKTTPTSSPRPSRKIINKKTSQNSPIASPKRSPKASPEVSPRSTKASPQVSPRSPKASQQVSPRSPKASPQVSPSQSRRKTPQNSPIDSQKRSPKASPQVSPSQSRRKTPENSPIASPKRSPKASPQVSPSQSRRNSIINRSSAVPLNKVITEKENVSPLTPKHSRNSPRKRRTQNKGIDEPLKVLPMLKKAPPRPSEQVSPRKFLPDISPGMLSPRLPHSPRRMVSPTPSQSPRSNSISSPIDNSSRRNSLRVESDGQRRSSIPINALIVAQKLKESQDKTQIITNLKKEIKQHHKIPESFDRSQFFNEVETLLTDDSWEVRQEATLLVKDLVPYFKDDIDQNLQIVLPSIIKNMGHREIPLQKSTVEFLRAYIPATNDKQMIIDKVLEYGLKRNKGSAKCKAVENLPKIINRSFSQTNLGNIVLALSNYLNTEELKTPSIEAIKRIQDLFGTQKFEGWTSKLDKKQRKHLYELLSAEDDPSLPDSHSQPEDEDDGDVVLVKAHVSPSPPAEKEGSRRNSRGWIEYGVVDQAIMDKIRNEVSNYS